MRAVTYFKLIDHKERPSGYTPWDVVKNCSLTGNEIDNNFFFLRGYDFENINAVTSETGTTLAFKRVNGDTISVPFSKIDDETIKALERKLNEEITARTDADTEITIALQEEISTRTDAVSALTQQINTLQERLTSAETRIEELERIIVNLDDRIKTVMYNTLEGTTGEIKKTIERNLDNTIKSIKMGFDDNAGFIANN